MHFVRCRLVYFASKKEWMEKTHTRCKCTSRNWRTKRDKRTSKKNPNRYFDDTSSSVFSFNFLFVQNEVTQQNMHKHKHIIHNKTYSRILDALRTKVFFYFYYYDYVFHRFGRCYRFVRFFAF